MADIISPEMRSRNMAAIKSKNTSPEILLRKWLFRRGYRYRLHQSSIPGHPDIFLKKYNTAVFVHGCFWHRHPECKYAYVPKSNIGKWELKFQNNMARDAAIKERLVESGIKVLVIWECTIKKMKKDIAEQEVCMNKVERFLNSTDNYCEM